MGRFTGILGLLTMLAMGYAFSTDRRAIRMKTVAWGLGLQLTFAVFVLRAEIGRMMFQKAGDGVNRLLSYAFSGSQFLFGELGKARFEARFLLRLSGSAHHHLYCGLVRDSLPHRRDAVRRETGSAGDDALHGRQWR